jgi:hypothetical protein
MKEPDFRTLGQPDLRMGGVSVWIRGREFPDASDYWDGNWLDVTVYCRYPGARVWCAGPVLRVPEVQGFLATCEALHRSLSGHATLACLEPNLNVHMVGTSRGSITMRVTMAPNHLQRHEFEEEIDQSYLPTIISECRAILRRFPILDQSDPAKPGAG